MRLGRLYDFRDSHLLYSLYVFLSSVIILHVEPLCLKKFWTKGQRRIRNACSRTWYIYQLFTSILEYFSLQLLRFCACTLEFLGGDGTFAKKVEST